MRAGSMRVGVVLVVLGLLAVLLGGQRAVGQPCEPAWVEGFSCLRGVDGPVYASVFWDDGSGSKLVVAGSFQIAGCTQASNIAMWDGERWQPLGEGVDGPVLALEVFDHGSGPALYAGGEFTSAGGMAVNHIARWDGLAWSALGQGVEGCTGSAFCDTEVLALEVFDDGTGSKLYVGGNFTRAGGDRDSKYLAAWNGAAWSRVAGGVPFEGSTNPRVFDLAAIDDTTGMRLFVAGRFTMVGGQPAESVAAWDGVAWEVIGDGTNISGDVRAVLWHDDGTGGALFIGGDMFVELPGGRAYGVAAWDGSAWSALGEGLDERNGDIYDMQVATLDGQQVLVAGGDFRTLSIEAIEHIGAWDGSRWRPVGPTIDCCAFTSLVQTLAVDPGSGLLFAGGEFRTIQDEYFMHIAAWDGVSWTSLGDGLENSTSDVVYFEFDGQGAWYTMAAIGDSRQQYELMRWNGSTFEGLGIFADGSATPSIVFDDGSGLALYFVGDFQTIGGVPASRIAKWDGRAWNPVGSGFNLPVRAAVVVEWEGRQRLLALGRFSATGDGRRVRGMAEWEGGQWVEFAGGIDTSSSRSVADVVVFEDAQGPGLFAGGDFTRIGGVTISGLARWDGAQWMSVGGLSGRVFDLQIFRVGDQLALFIGGLIGTRDIAAWTATGFADIGGGASGCPGGCLSRVSNMAVFDDGMGEKLYVGGQFLSMDRIDDTEYIAAWDGTQWSALPGGGLNGRALVVEPIETADGPGLFVSGDFTLAGGVGSANAAILQGCPLCPADLDGDSQLTMFDFRAFQNLFDAGDPRADFDGDGTLTLFDFLAFQNAFDAGCP